MTQLDTYGPRQIGRRPQQPNKFRETVKAARLAMTNMEDLEPNRGVRPPLSEMEIEVLRHIMAERREWQAQDLLIRKSMKKGEKKTTRGSQIPEPGTVLSEVAEVLSSKATSFPPIRPSPVQPVPNGVPLPNSEWVKVDQPVEKKKRTRKYAGWEPGMVDLAGELIPDPASLPKGERKSAAMRVLQVRKAEAGTNVMSTDQKDKIRASWEKRKEKYGPTGKTVHKEEES
jgi:hypothetical protein